MKYVKPSEVDGVLNAPPSKSEMQRVLIAAALAKGKTIITNPSFCADSLATMNVMRLLGAKIEKDDEKVEITGGNKPVSNILDCQESGTCMRMISAIAATYPEEFTITGSGSLMKRPAGMIVEPLKKLGAECKTSNGLLPVTVKGPIHGGRVEIDGSQTSQFLSGLLMALPLCEEDSEISVANLKSHRYTDLTENIAKKFGITMCSDEKKEKFLIPGNQKYQPAKIRIEGDWSAAAFLLVAGAIAGKVEVIGIESAVQPDLAVKSILSESGAKIKFKGNNLICEKAPLRAFEYDATDTPDLFPPLAVLACNCRGKSTIHGAERLKHKESDRAAVLMKELGKLGANIKVIGNRMEIEGRKLKGGSIDSHNDHRIAMAGAVAALTSEEGVRISDPECVSKSYPGFFQDLESIMVNK